MASHGPGSRRLTAVVGQKASKQAARADVFDFGCVVVSHAYPFEQAFPGPHHT